MKAFLFAFAILTVASGSAELQPSEVLVKILSQFLSSTGKERETTTSPGLLPKILNPLHWIPNFENIPYNPDSELTTVSS